MALRFVRSLILLTLFILVVTPLSTQRSQAAPAATRGNLDLTHWDFGRDGPVSLDGEWEFYWGQLLTPQDFWERSDFAKAKTSSAATTTARVPGSWDTGTRHPGHGYATYRLLITLESQQELMALYIPYARTAYKLWINDTLMATDGDVATTPGASRPHYRPTIVRFQPGDRVVQVVVQVSNFAQRAGGLWTNLELGTDAQISGEVRHRLMAQMILVGLLLGMGLYHLGVYHQRESSTAYFGFFCLIVAIRMLVTGDLPIMWFFPRLPWAAILKTDYLTYYVGLPTFLAFLWRLFPEEVSRRALLSLTSVAAFLTLVVLSTSTLFLYTLRFYQAVTLITLAYMVYTVGIAAKRRRPGARLILWGCGFGALMVTNDILFYNGIVPTVELMPVGLSVFIFIQAMILSDRFSELFNRQVHLTRALRRSRSMITEREEATRSQIADLLHGRVQSRLLLIWHTLSDAIASLNQSPKQAECLITRAQNELDQVRNDEVRRISHMLHPTVLRFGLLPPLRTLGERFGQKLAVTIEASSDFRKLDLPQDAGIPFPVRLAVYRIAEEALTNVVKHADATRAEIRLAIGSDGGISIVIQDDGIGVDPSVAGTGGLGFAMFDIRLDQVGGNWSLESPPNSGTIITINIPLPPSGEAIS